MKCLYTPCHTTGSICYYVTDDSGDDKAVFTGDTLFIGGNKKFYSLTFIEADCKFFNLEWSLAWMVSTV